MRRLSQDCECRSCDRTQPDARGLASLASVDSRVDSEARREDCEGIRKIRRCHAQDIWRPAHRGAARSARAIPVESQVKIYLRHPFWQAVGLLVLAYLVIVCLITVLPGSAMVPRSVVLQYIATLLVAVLIWVSDDEARWTQFKEPMHDVLVQPRLKVV